MRDILLWKGPWGFPTEEVEGPQSPWKLRREKEWARNEKKCVESSWKNKEEYAWEERRGEEKVRRAVTCRAVTAAGAPTGETPGAVLLVITHGCADHRVPEEFHCQGGKVVALWL